MELGINNNNYAIQNSSIKKTSPNFKGIFSNLLCRKNTVGWGLKTDSFIKNPDVINIRKQGKLSKYLSLLKCAIIGDNKEKWLKKSLKIIKKEEANDITMFIYKVLDFTKNNIDKVYGTSDFALGRVMDPDFKEIYTLCNYLLRNHHKYTGATKNDLRQKIKAAEDTLAKYTLKK